MIVDHFQEHIISLSVRFGVGGRDRGDARETFYNSVMLPRCTLCAALWPCSKELHDLMDYTERTRLHACVGK